MDKFIDRHEAGVILAKYLKGYKNKPNVIILALPRGGVPIGYEIASALSVPLDIFIVRKLGLPGYEEIAMSAIASGSTVFFNEPLLNQFKLNRSQIQNVVEKEREELFRREQLYRGSKPFPNLKDKIVILVDDGIATGSTMVAAIEALHSHKPQSIIVAVPVAAFSTCEEIAPLVERIVCPLKPLNFYAVGLWYENFPQISDDEVIDVLKKSHSNNSARQVNHDLF
ncbi:MAG TPA: phosphoribosyltransferase [Legionella sp.]|nr:phosphoribosyltransferase [Legionella sp.]